MTCEACETTRARRGHWHRYEDGCVGCAARAVARSQSAWSAIKQRPVPQDVEPLRDMIERIFPQLSAEDARRAVWEWWQLDHLVDPK